MTDLLVGIGIALMIEGVIWAAAPGFARQALDAIKQYSEMHLRLGALLVAVFGLALIWFARSGSFSL